MLQIFKFCCISSNMENHTDPERLSNHNVSQVRNPKTDGIFDGDPIAVVQLIVNLAGILGNGLIITLLRRRSLGGRLPTIFFRSQAVFDLMVNLESVLFGLKAGSWNVHTEWLNTTLCRLWHSQFLFWFAVQLSIGNLILIGMERFLALCFPLVYRRLQPVKVAYCSLTVNLLYNLILAIPNILEMGVERGCCVPQHHWKIVKLLLSIYAVVWFILIYALGLVLLCISYGGVIFALRHSPSLHRNQPQFRSAALLRFTRMALVITVVYLLCISFDAYAYALGHAGQLVYNYDTKLHKIGMLFVSVNSFANPYIYYLFVLHDSCLRKFRSRTEGHRRSGKLSGSSNEPISDPRSVSQSPRLSATS